MTEKDILEHMRNLCAARECCSNELRDKIMKLAAKGGIEVDADAMLASLAAERWYDDARYAAAFVRDKSGLAGWGPAKIRYALSRKGITGAIAAEALKEADSERAASKMNDVLSAKLRTLKGDEETIRAKLYRFALGRGYSYDQIREWLESR